jgi:hypothetical protein
MSASSSPPNPGQPRKNPSAPPPRSLLRRAGPGLFAAGATVTFAYTYFFRNSPNSAPNPLRTPGVKNIEAAYRGAGATATHTPAYGGTRQGERDVDNFRGDGEGTNKKDGSPTMKSDGKREFNVSGPNEQTGGPSRDIGEVQRPAGAQATGVGKMWNKFKYGNEDQK